MQITNLERLHMGLREPLDSRWMAQEYASIEIVKESRVKVVSRDRSR